ALDEDALLHGGAHHAAEIEAADRAAGAGALAGGIEGDGEGGPAESVLEARGEQADDARMPALAGRQDDGGAFAGAVFRLRLGLRLGQHGSLHRLALAVEIVELLCDSLGLARLVDGEKPAAERRIADAPAGID